MTVTSVNPDPISSSHKRDDPPPTSTNRSDRPTPARLMKSSDNCGFRWYQVSCSGDRRSCTAFQCPGPAPMLIWASIGPLFHTKAGFAAASDSPPQRAFCRGLNPSGGWIPRRGEGPCA
jgi:hypothetical protein